jgi:hypothetical protein
MYCSDGCRGYFCLGKREMFFTTLMKLERLRLETKEENSTEKGMWLTTP